MAYDKFLIAPFNNGLNLSLPTWQTPDESFQELDNVNIFRGRIKKRFGGELTGLTSLTSRTRILLAQYTIPGGVAVGITDGSGDATGTLTGFIFSIGQRFTIGDEVYTLTTLGAPATLVADSGAATTKTLNTTTGVFAFIAAAVDEQIYFHCDGSGGEIATDAGTGNAAGYVPGYNTYHAGQLFSIGDEIYTVPTTGTPVVMLKSSGAATTHTFNTTTGAFVFEGADKDKAIYFYSAEPIMELTHYEKGSVNEHVTYAMDTQFIYKYSGSDWIKDTTFTGILHGSNKEFFWSNNYVGAAANQIALFTTNFNSTAGVPSADDDHIYSYNDTTWENFSLYTKYNAAKDYVESAKIILSWKNRLLLLNVVQKDISGPTNTIFHNRVRYSHNGSPFPSGVTGGHPWLERRQTYVDGAVTYKGDGGGYIDLPTEEEIVSAAVIKDRLIIYCERSTWELAYTGNTGLPFVWKGLDDNVGSEATYSTVPFDNEAVTVATTGIYTCNGLNTTRIDKDIPSEVFSFLKTSDGTARVHGVRDYYNGLAYWTILEHEKSTLNTYPNKVLVFNYESRAWSFYDDTITTFGYFEQSSDKTWAETGTWNTADTWGSFYEQANSRLLIAGNHQGFIFRMNNDEPKNAPVMTVANVTIADGVPTLTIPDHNLVSNEYVKFDDDNLALPDDGIYKVTRTSADVITLFSTTAFSGTYLGGGTITRVSKINIRSKDWNPYVKDGKSVHLGKIDFCVLNTAQETATGGEVTVDYSVDSTNFNLVEQAEISKASLGSNVLEMHPYALENDLASYKKVLWRSVYFQASGDSVNINITLSDEQMTNPVCSLALFELQGMILNTSVEGN